MSKTKFAILDAIKECQVTWKDGIISVVSPDLRCQLKITKSQAMIVYAGGIGVCSLQVKASENIKPTEIVEE